MQSFPFCAVAYDILQDLISNTESKKKSSQWFQISKKDELNQAFVSRWALRISDSMLLDSLRKTFVSDCYYHLERYQTQA